MDLIIATALGAFSVSLLIGYGVSRFFAKQNPVLQRLHRYVVEDHERRRAEGLMLKGGRLRPTLVRVLQTVSEFMPVNEQYTKGLRLSLLQAGIYRLDAARIFSGVQLVSTVLFLGLGITLAMAVHRGTLASIAVTMMLAFFGYYVPLVWLKRTISHRKKQVVTGLPDALDLMVVCVEAGLGLNAALLRVGEELGRHCPAISQEFMLVNREMRAGVSRHDALRHLAQRNPVEDIQSFVAILIQTDKLGSSMSKTLRTQSDSLRGKRKQRAEEAAAKTSIKLLFPLVFFILPSLFVVLLGPGILQVVKAFSGNSLP